VVVGSGCRVVMVAVATGRILKRSRATGVR